MKLTILELMKTETANPMKGILVISKYLKLGIPEAKEIVTSLPGDLNAGVLTTFELEDFKEALASCGIKATEKPLLLPSGQTITLPFLLSYIDALYHLEAQILLCRSILKYSSDASCTTPFSDRLSAAKETLEKLYSLNLLSLKHRQLIPVCQFKDYLESGRCTELEGPEGAYALYEKELKQHKITNHINTAVTDYIALSENQHGLCLAIQEARAAKYTALTAEQAAVLIRRMEAEEQSLWENLGPVS